MSVNTIHYHRMKGLILKILFYCILCNILSNIYYLLQFCIITNIESNHMIYVFIGYIIMDGCDKKLNHLV
jgi:hypothetical protein